LLDPVPFASVPMAAELQGNRNRGVLQPD